MKWVTILVLAILYATSIYALKSTSDSYEVYWYQGSVGQVGVNTSNYTTSYGGTDIQSYSDSTSYSSKLGIHYIYDNQFLNITIPSSNATNGSTIPDTSGTPEEDDTEDIIIIHDENITIINVTIINQTIQEIFMEAAEIPKNIIKDWDNYNPTYKTCILISSLFALVIIISYFWLIITYFKRDKGDKPIFWVESFGLRVFIIIALIAGLIAFILCMWGVYDNNSTVINEFFNTFSDRPPSHKVLFLVSFLLLLFFTISYIWLVIELNKKKVIKKEEYVF